MPDIIKEFNMTDLLGMLVPGSVVAFFLDKQYGFLNCIEKLTHTEFSSGIIIILVLVAGYFLGMLLHEIGDILERILWWFPGFNPRLYAAHVAGLGACKKDDIPQTTLSVWIWISFILSFLLACFLVWISLLIFEKMSMWWMWWLIFSLPLVFSLLASCNMWLKLGKGDFRTVLREALSLCRFNKPLLYSVWEVSNNNDEYVRMVLRKRDLFDGFRTAARNLLVTFFLLGVSACKTKGILSTLRSAVLHNTDFFWIVIITLCILLWRYYHFTYLRYKYCYEDYIHQVAHDSSEG